jgi:hypothetical protein
MWFNFQAAMLRASKTDHATLLLYYSFHKLSWNKYRFLSPGRGTLVNTGKNLHDRQSRDISWEGRYFLEIKVCNCCSGMTEQLWNCEVGASTMIDMSARCVSQSPNVYTWKNRFEPADGGSRQQGCIEIVSMLPL